MVPEFLEQIYSLSETSEADLLIALIFDFFDDSLLEDRFEKCDGILSGCDVSRLADTAILAILLVTHSARHQLPSRPEFWNRGFDRISSTHGEEYAKKLLGARDMREGDRE